MDTDVIIKANSHGIRIIFHNDDPLEQLLMDIKEKLQHQNAFLKKEGKISVSFEGRELSREEIAQILFALNHLPETEVEYSEGDTVFDLLCQVTDQYGIQMEYNGTAGKEYIEGIQNLYEYDGGRWSGWMYSVNGEYPGTGCGDCQVSDGDRIEWNYTCDLGMDLEGADMEDAAEWKETHE